MEGENFEDSQRQPPNNNTNSYARCSHTPERCLMLTQKNSNLTFTFSLVQNGYNLPTLLHLKHTMEFFWNQHLEHSQRPALPNTTHGRAVARGENI